MSDPMDILDEYMERRVQQTDALVAGVESGGAYDRGLLDFLVRREADNQRMILYLGMQMILERERSRIICEHLTNGDEVWNQVDELFTASRAGVEFNGEQVDELLERLFPPEGESP